MHNDLITASPEHASRDERVTPRVSTRTSTLNRVRPLLLLVFTLITALVPSAKAANSTQQALEKADAFLSTEERGKEILSYVHLGAEYHGHQYLRTRPVDNNPEAFALVYRFRWEDDGITDVAFLCDSRGYVYQVQIVWTNAVWNQPFVFANASIRILGNSLIEMYKDKLSEDERRQLRELVRNADAKSLLELSLMLEQRFD